MYTFVHVAGCLPASLSLCASPDTLLTEEYTVQVPVCADARSGARSCSALSSQQSQQQSARVPLQPPQSPDSPKINTAYTIHNPNGLVFQH